MADYIAQKADVWAVEQTIHGAPEDHPYTDSCIENRRQRIFQNFMELVSEEITRRYPDASVIRQEARAKVIRKIQQAIEMSLSKSDQVLVVGNSRLLAKRLDVPKCVTCDRPLHNQKNPYRDDDALADTPVLEGLSRPDSTAAFNPQTSELGFRGGLPKTHYRKQQRHQDQNRRRLDEASERASVNRPRTVVRGGFRMPKGSLSEDIQARMSPNVIEVQRQVEREDERDPILRESTSLPTLAGGTVLSR